MLSHYRVEQQRVKDNALQLVPDSPTVCFGVNETAKRGGKRGEEGKKKGQRTKRDRKKGTQGRKSNCFIGCNRIIMFFNKEMDLSAATQSPIHTLMVKAGTIIRVNIICNKHTVYKYNAVEECFYIDGLNPSVED